MGFLGFREGKNKPETMASTGGSHEGDSCNPAGSSKYGRLEKSGDGLICVAINRD